MSIYRQLFVDGRPVTCAILDRAGDLVMGSTGQFDERHRPVVVVRRKGTRGWGIGDPWISRPDDELVSAGEVTHE